MFQWIEACYCDVRVLQTVPVLLIRLRWKAPAAAFCHPNLVVMARRIDAGCGNMKASCERAGGLLGKLG
jgi:hypothetical protein